MSIYISGIIHICMLNTNVCTVYILCISSYIIYILCMLAIQIVLCTCICRGHKIILIFVEIDFRTWYTLRKQYG